MWTTFTLAKKTTAYGQLFPCVRFWKICDVYNDIFFVTISAVKYADQLVAPIISIQFEQNAIGIACALKVCHFLSIRTFSETISIIIIIIINQMRSTNCKWLTCTFPERIEKQTTEHVVQPINMNSNNRIIKWNASLKWNLEIFTSNYQLIVLFERRGWRRTKRGRAPLRNRGSV